MGRSFETALVRDGGEPVCERCSVAQSPLTRLRGLLGRAGLGPQEGLLIRPTSAIHTCFMRFPIDAVFLSRELVVVGVQAELRPWRVAARRGAKAVLELPAGESRRRGIQPGERFRLADPLAD
jgi:uncharacterized membrane protein (UPF0127 family)